MLEDLRMDSHKLIYHPQRVSDWLNGKIIYPITVEISPSGTCNHRCIFCGLDYLGYRTRFLDKELILPNLGHMQAKGVKAVVLAGEGEPFLNRDTPEIIRFSREIDLDIGVSTNGVLFTREVARECLPSINWVRFSVNATSEEYYQVVHRGRRGDFEKVLQNINNAVDLKREMRLKTTIGVQLVLIPENSRGLITFAERLKEIGVDYFALKPYSQHPQSNSRIDPDFNYNDYLELEAVFNAMNDSSYQVIFRADSMKKLENEERRYKYCLGVPFWAYIDSNGTVWPCLAYIGKEEFCLGDLNEEGFVSIWEGKRAREIVKMMSSMDISKCRELCRLDSINEYLHHLANPGAHVNFI